MSLEKREMMRPEGVVSVKAKGAKKTACSIKLCIPSLATSIPRRSKMSKSNCTTPDRTEAHSQRHCGCAKQGSIAVPTTNFTTLIRQKQNYSFFIWLPTQKWPVMNYIENKEQTWNSHKITINVLLMNASMSPATAF